MEVQPFRAGLEGEADDGFCYIVNRDDVEEKVGSRGQDPKQPREVEPQGEVKGIEGLDGTRARVADDHARAEDRNGQLCFARLHQAFALVFAELVGARKAELVGEGVLGHGTCPTSGHIGGGDVGKADQPVIPVGSASQLQHVCRPLDVGLAQLGDGSVDTQVRRRVDDVGDPAHQMIVGGLSQAQAG